MDNDLFEGGASHPDFVEFQPSSGFGLAQNFMNMPGINLGSMF